MIASAQEPVRLELRIMPEDGSLPGVITERTGTRHEDITGSGQVRRFEVQHRIRVLNPSAATPAGLTALQLNICASGQLGGSTIRWAKLSQAERGGELTPLFSDASGTSSPLVSGRHTPFRGAVGNSPEGTVVGSCITNITPLTLSQSDQGGASDLTWYGLYSFEMVSGAGVCGCITLTASPQVDSVTHYAFAYFDDGNPVPISSGNFITRPAEVFAVGMCAACAPPVCPEDGAGAPTVIVTCPITGAVTGLGWYWRLESDPSGTPFAGMSTASYVRGDPTNQTTLDVANDFADAINRYYSDFPRSCSASQISAAAETGAGGSANLSIRTAGGGRARLFVGTAAMGNATCLVSTTSSCPFQPSITQLPLPGRDCNGNGVDDLLDIDSGRSADANADGVPDECQSACQLTIASSPVSVRQYRGGTAVFTVEAAATGTASYQWFKGGVAIGNGPSGGGGTYTGATSKSLMVAGVQLGDAGRYSCRVTASCGPRLTTAAATLTINCPADYNGSLAVTVQDVFDFLADYFSGAPSADINGSGSLSVQDVFDFLFAYFSGC